MAFTVSTVAELIPSWSLGPVKVQVFTWTGISSDTALVVTADRLSRAKFGVCEGAVQTAAATLSNNVITFTISDIGATKAGQVIVYGD